MNILVFYWAAAVIPGYEVFTGKGKRMQRFQFVFSDNVGCPLGRISYAGIKWDSGGAPWFSPMRINEAFLLVYTLEGEARYQDASGMDCILGEGRLFLLPPGLAHAYVPVAGSCWSEFHMWLSGPIWDIWLQTNAGPPAVLFFDGLPAALWLDRFIRALASSESQSPAASWRRISHLQSILADMMGTGDCSSLDLGEEAQIREARELLETSLLCEPSLDDVARATGMSYETFRKKFTMAVGVSPGRYRTRHIMQRACHMLGEEHLTIKETAMRLGFSDEFHFSRRFKNTMGVLPSSFRRSMGNRKN